MTHSKLSANSVQDAPNTALPATVPPSGLSDRHERFCQELLSNGGNLSDAYRAVYPGAGSQVAVWNNACRLRARADVRARMRKLQAAAAERTVITVQQQLVELAEQAAVDVTELQPIIPA
jgi:phage terminase small subunit